jgi:hypothetical protein
MENDKMSFDCLLIIICLVVKKTGFYSQIKTDLVELDPHSERQMWLIYVLLCQNSLKSPRRFSRPHALTLGNFYPLNILKTKSIGNCWSMNKCVCVSFSFSFSMSCHLHVCLSLFCLLLSLVIPS